VEAISPQKVHQKWMSVRLSEMDEITIVSKSKISIVSNTIEITIVIKVQIIIKILIKNCP
jgi:hypothetical protein